MEPGNVALEDARLTTALLRPVLAELWVSKGVVRALALAFTYCICSCYHSLQGPSSSVLWLWPQPQSPLSAGLILSPVWGYETTSVQAAVQRSKTGCLSGVFSLACTAACVCGWLHILHLPCPHYSWCPSGCSHIHVMCLIFSVPTTSDIHMHLINASW